MTDKQEALSVDLLRETLTEVKRLSLQMVEVCTNVKHMQEQLSVTKEVSAKLGELHNIVTVFAGKVDGLQKDVTAMLESQKAQGERIGKLERRTAELGALPAKVACLETWREDVKNAPAKNLSKLKMAVAISIATGIVGLLIGWFGHFFSAGQ